MCVWKWVFAYTKNKAAVEELKREHVSWFTVIHIIPMNQLYQLFGVPWFFQTNPYEGFLE